MNKVFVFAMLMSLFIFGGMGYQIGKANTPKAFCQSYQQGYTDGQIDYGKGRIKVAQVQFAPNDVDWIDTTNWDTTGWNVQFIPVFDSANIEHYSIE